MFSTDFRLLSFCLCHAFEISFNQHISIATLLVLDGQRTQICPLKWNLTLATVLKCKKKEGSNLIWDFKRPKSYTKCIKQGFFFPQRIFLKPILILLHSQERCDSRFLTLTKKPFKCRCVSIHRPLFVLGPAGCLFYPPFSRTVLLFRVEVKHTLAAFRSANIPKSVSDR